ncbi:MULTISPECIES: type I restriction enzyme HsdR N-terminal domain-containing protein [unclassified Methylophilus]|nr:MULTISPECIES: type I restriction enzyme HsdR N-terminal domain-containing protein [unclassified Methylophilus]MBF4988049.1 type I restriction enzyme HsdR N-terminal domain-containing protein [Methylophilus sp. 14]MBF4992086.1 type I restriction enzyme HsdR N-terminal domain-containing protein [Methylophilus sp. QUAN]
MALPKKVVERLTLNLKRYQTILADAKNRDISESDTVVILADMLAELLGYKKYLEITTEFAIRGTYVDLAVKVGDDVRFLVEVKAINIDLKENHVKQAIDYGANHGIEWVVLTNGAVWQFYKIHFDKPIDKSLIFEVDLLQTTAKNTQLIECFGNLSREGFTQSSMTAFYQQQQATSKYSIGALLTTEAVLLTIKKELKKLSPTSKIEDDFLKNLLLTDVIKRELIEGEQATAAIELIKKCARAQARLKAKAVIQ